MVMGLSLNGLEEEEVKRWIRAYREEPGPELQPNLFELEVELLHSDYSSIGTKSGSKRFPDSLNLVKFDGSILRTETDVVLAPGNTFIMSTIPGAPMRLQREPASDLTLRDLVRVSGGGVCRTKSVELSLKLATNITSKVSFWGVTQPFELFAKPQASSEGSLEMLRRQGSAHSLASLASLASMGLQACESDDELSEAGTEHPAPSARTALDRDDSGGLLNGSSRELPEAAGSNVYKRVKTHHPPLHETCQQQTSACTNPSAAASCTDPSGARLLWEHSLNSARFLPAAPANMSDAFNHTQHIKKQQPFVASMEFIAAD